MATKPISLPVAEEVKLDLERLVPNHSFIRV
jgi:hypothetical protein